MRHKLRFVERSELCGMGPDIARTVNILQFYDSVLDEKGSAPGWTDVPLVSLGEIEEPGENTRNFQKVEDTGLSLLPTVSSLAANIRRQMKNISKMLAVGNERDGRIMDCVANADDHAHRIQEECRGDE